MKRGLPNKATTTLSGLATFVLSVVIALAVEHWLARFVWHEAASYERFVPTLVGLLYVDCWSRMEVTK